jgi:UDP-N-acetylglucosamine 2-epimerase (non-hydrolysing)
LLKNYDYRMASHERVKLLLVVGTRPEVIKMAPVYFELSKHPEFIVQLCATGQHSDLLLLALKDFGLTPDYRLDLMEHGQSLGKLTGRAIMGLEEILAHAKPAAVLVHGDTTTTFAAALAAFYAQIPVGHVEAGLRTRNIYSPFPEEFNRQGVSRIAKWNFAPTSQASVNLVEDGVPEKQIIETGNTVVDALRILSEEAKEGRLESSWDELKAMLGFDPSTQKTVLVTTHRRENLGNGVGSIFEAIQGLADKFPEAMFVLPLHPNPQIRLSAVNLEKQPNVRVIDPLGYRNFMLLLSTSHLTITDSGGIQEEAVTLGKKVLVARDSTERPEGLASTNMEIVGSSKEEILRVGSQQLEREWLPGSLQIESHVYGDGRASERISEALLTFFLKSKKATL